jgi:hypothetical protein
MTHEKKIFSKYFIAILEKRKTFEVRNEDDVIYHVGDYIVLRECDNGIYSGRALLVKITYKLKIGFVRGKGQHVCILGIVLV